MARNESHRWWDWRVDRGGRSIRSASRGPAKPGAKKKRPSSARVFWWTFTAKDGRCDGCSAAISRGSKVAYRHRPKKMLCSRCIVKKRLTPRHSKKFREAG